MLKFQNANEMLGCQEILDTPQFEFKRHVYCFKSKTDLCRRGGEELKAVNFRCEEERHNISVFYNPEKIRYIETGYSSS